MNKPPTLTAEQRAANAIKNRETKRRKAQLRVELNAPTLMQAVDLNCKDCIYDPLAGGGWYEQVARCEITDCPFYHYRRGGALAAEKK